MEENSKKPISTKTIIIAVIIVVLIAIIGVLAFMLIQNNNSNQGTSNNNSQTFFGNNSKKETKAMSFKQLDATDKSLTEAQRAVALYFDEDYFHLYSYEELPRYADTLKNMNMSAYAQVNTILSTDGENFEALCQWAAYTEDFWGIETAELTAPIIIKGKKPEEMVLPGDNITVKGKLVGAETRTINGKNMYLPVIEVTSITGEYLWHSEEALHQVANAIFGNNIKFRRPSTDESTKMFSESYYTPQDWVYLIEFENQSNLNFKVFDIWQSIPGGMITYNGIYNQGLEKDYINKQIYITPDLQKYIVFDYSRLDKRVYISVYNRELNKLWSREINNVSNICWDATNTNLVFVSDNDLYNINIENGEDIQKPVYVGKKIDVRIVENGYILLSNTSDDAVMFVDKAGNIAQKHDIKLNSNDQIWSQSVQKIDNNYTILFNIYNENNTNLGFTSKFITIDANGNKINETK